VVRPVRNITALLILLGSSVRVFALDPKLDVSQYAHKAWRVRDGFTKGAITSLAQTSDGYLWLGTEFGLVRFDGVRAVPWRPPIRQQLPSNRADFRLHVEGTPRNLSPIVRDEVYRIACEAVRNAFRHACAGRIELEIRYDWRQFRLLVRDNGKGIDPKVLSGDGLPGHYGLPGMHERAQQIGGKLSVWSKLDFGTEAVLTIPASIAYEKSSGARRPMFFRRGA
jgi:hypothetical protein